MCYRKRNRDNRYLDIMTLDIFEHVLSNDLVEYNREFEWHKNAKTKNNGNVYKIFFRKIVPYKVPIATQSAIAIYKDLEGNIINDVYDNDCKEQISFFHICIFPLGKESVILCFFAKKDSKKYRRLWNQFNCLDNEKKIQYINY